ncbi:hypothetical protein, conserved [Leishmania tarentolae]|uniref:Secreted protein n=1 Tax=Leishmania tarentolae TaxID=5689 RepID=A0A640KFX1_LEITA|nr:hypothetical protein, conserved [Leishmania tarentolae]
MHRARHLLWILAVIVHGEGADESNRQNVRVVALQCLQDNVTGAQVLFIGVSGGDVLGHSVKGLLRKATAHHARAAQHGSSSSALAFCWEIEGRVRTCAR